MMRRVFVSLNKSNSRLTKSGKQLFVFQSSADCIHEKLLAFCRRGSGAEIQSSNYSCFDNMLMAYTKNCRRFIWTQFL